MADIKLLLQNLPKDARCSIVEIVGSPSLGPVFGHGNGAAAAREMFQFCRNRHGTPLNPVQTAAHKRLCALAPVHVRGCTHDI